MPLRKIAPSSWRYRHVRPKLPASKMREQILLRLYKGKSLTDLFQTYHWVDVLRHPQVRRLVREGLVEVRRSHGRTPSWRGGAPSNYTRLGLTERGVEVVFAGEMPKPKVAAKSERVERLTRHVHRR